VILPPIVQAPIIPEKPKKKSAFALAREANKEKGKARESPPVRAPLSKGPVTPLHTEIQESSEAEAPFIEINSDVIFNEIKEREEPLSDKIEFEPPRFAQASFPTVEHRLAASKYQNLDKKQTGISDDLSASEKEIDRENQKRIQQMSVDDVAAAQKEILSNLSPEIIELLKKRGAKKLGLPAEYPKGEKEEKKEEKQVEERPTKMVNTPPPPSRKMMEQKIERFALSPCPLYQRRFNS